MPIPGLTRETGQQVAREAEMLTQAQVALTKGNMDQAKLAEREECPSRPGGTTGNGRGQRQA